MSRLNYILVTEENAKKLGKEFRQQVDGLYILEEKDFNNVEGDFLYQRIAPYGGQIITHAEMIQKLEGKKQVPKSDFFIEVPDEAPYDVYEPKEDEIEPKEESEVTNG